MGAGRCTAAPAGSRRTRTGAISSCSTNTSTATTARGSARATRPDGRASSRVPCTCSRPPPPSRLSSLARTLRPSRRRRRRPRAVAGGPDMSPAYPSLYQVNTRVLLTALSRTLGRPATLDDIPDAELDRIAGLGFDYVWLLSVRRTGSAGQRVSRAHAGWRHEFEDTLPDLCAEDIAGSGFAITGYTAHPAVGGTAALARTRRRLQARGLKLMLDFVPNHTALDHPWVEDHRDRRAVRRRALRHGDAGSAEDLRTHLGPATAPVLGAGHPAREEAGVRRASTTPTTSASTT